MHLLSQCLLYALGLKENTRNDGQLVVTPGGEFREGLHVIEKLLGYAVTLMRRSVFNHYAFTQYFESAPASDRDVWTSITMDDWKLIIEMEAVTDQLAQFSLGEVQKESVASSYCTVLSCLVIHRPDAKATEFTQRRETKQACHFSRGGVRCRDRLREQLALRFPRKRASL
ncbi:hypothetical protein PHYSODRAFT_308840 [Phytophthora sojae]|uniref:Uncharacterized protein n=1 Tax=Phytophthora sojae (strain P6497) TaxID=1094619 RepID=G4YIE6_PHYSP|nr:hypothetical protein PHYSODRAFT_308840 [Phytophthora sojae]EGZ27749.1 hypothetical protein PHYSODRAFT_308840 [Phytophthora sojae]|eukprot:XP_009515024.1 hypothetical protein PHYSODRAFT_308840 [Phytophthora sojae]